MEEKYNNKKIGKIFSFDGEAGIIITPDSYYHFDKKDFLNDDLKVGSLVEFVSNTLKIGNDKEHIALYISKIDIEKGKDNH